MKKGEMYLLTFNNTEENNEYLPAENKHSKLLYIFLIVLFLSLCVMDGSRDKKREIRQLGKYMCVYVYLHYFLLACFPFHCIVETVTISYYAHFTHFVSLERCS